MKKETDVMFLSLTMIQKQTDVIFSEITGQDIKTKNPKYGHIPDYDILAKHTKCQTYLDPYEILLPMEVIL